jgi:hypothetical protein
LARVSTCIDGLDHPIARAIDASRSSTRAPETASGPVAKPFWPSTGLAGRRAASRPGVRQGPFCLGRGWTLTIVMVGLAATRWGRYLTRPVGFALIAWAALQSLRLGGLFG